jgi:hypothetical protein
LRILFSTILCTCSNQRNLCSLIVSIMRGFLTIGLQAMLRIPTVWDNFACF